MFCQNPQILATQCRCQHGSFLQPDAEPTLVQRPIHHVTVAQVGVETPAGEPQHDGEETQMLPVRILAVVDRCNPASQNRGQLQGHPMRGGEFRNAGQQRIAAACLVRHGPVQQCLAKSPGGKDPVRWSEHVDQFEQQGRRIGSIGRRETKP